MYEDYDDIDRFVLVVEQLAVCRSLLLTGTIGKARMALILLDNVADVLLFRRCESVYWTAKEWQFFGPRQYSKSERKQAERNFEKRIEVAQDHDYESRFGDVNDPMISETRATILKIGHSYRNAAYHRDTHNPRALPVVGRLLFEAVGGMFARADSGRSTLGGYSRNRFAPIEDVLGEIPKAISFRSAAERVVTNLSADLGVELDKLQETLADDLRMRTERVESFADNLPTESTEDLDELIGVFEFWEHHEFDDQLQALRPRLDPVRRAIQDDRDVKDGIEDLTEEAEAAQSRYRARILELARSTRPRLSSSLIEKAGKAVERLPELDSVPEVATFYAEIDEDLTVLEELLSTAVSEWDRIIDMRMEEMRGK